MALEEIRQDMQERQHRWQTIENFCGFSIRTNPGMAKIQAALYGEGGSIEHTSSNTKLLVNYGAFWLIFFCLKLIKYIFVRPYNERS